ncbi:hypothetical protein ACFLTY_00010 [Chloroflexota bacterium]
MPVEILRPNANGDLVQLYTYPGDGIHWNKVSDVVPDDDATYVHRYGGTTGTSYDSYHLADPVAGGVVITNVRVVARVRRIAMNPSGTHSTTIGLGLRVNGLNYYGNSSISSNSYVTISRSYATNPNTGLAWTVADINALQAFLGLGFYNLALWQGGLISGRCTQLYVEVTYLSLPSVTTMLSTNVEATSATINGVLDSDGGLPSDCGFEWGLDTGYGFVTPTEPKSTGENFSQVLGSLQSNTTYHFRAFATNFYGTSYGSDQSFTTPSILPVVDTLSAIDIDVNKATLRGILMNDGGENCDCSFEWGLTSGYGNETSWQSGKGAGDAFAQLISGLESDKTYHFRARARNSAGLVNGLIMTFRTLKEIVYVPPSLVDPSLKLLLEEET